LLAVGARQESREGLDARGALARAGDLQIVRGDPRVGEVCNPLRIEQEREVLACVFERGRVGDEVDERAAPWAAASRARYAAAAVQAEARSPNSPRAALRRGRQRGGGIRARAPAGATSSTRPPPAAPGGGYRIEQRPTDRMSSRSHFNARSVLLQRLR